MTTFSLYDVTVSAFEKHLTGLAWVLCKAENHYRAEGRDTAQLMADALAPNMFPFGMQVALAVQQSAGAVERQLGWGDMPLRPCGTLQEARQSVDEAMAKLKAIKPSDLDAALDRKAIWDPRGTGAGRQFDDAKDYLVDFALPNFWFHYTTAYALVRRNGAPLVKSDFLARGEPPEGLTAS